MKKLNYQKDYIYVNKENGNAGHEILLPDNADLYVWAKCTQENYNKWKDSNNQNLINQQIINTIAQIPIITNDDDSKLSIDIKSLDIKFDDTVYTFKQLMNDSGVTLFNDVDLLYKEYLIEENNQRFKLTK